jgi:NAD-specific glutamate dehydrogenase
MRVKLEAYLVNAIDKDTAKFMGFSNGVAIADG